MNKTLSEIFKDKYIIPLYQRNFAWRSEEILQLLQDIYEAKHNNKPFYYIGSLVVLRRHNGDFEVIDGQQRLTVLSLVAKLLGKNSQPILFYDSRPEVNEFFSTFCANGNIDNLSASTLFYFKEAIECICNAKIVDKRNDNKENREQLYIKADISDYFWNQVVLVRTEIPEDTDVASYFEIMNNRGEQLQKHEIVKAQMMKTILLPNTNNKYDIGKQKLFAHIWDKCSQMDTPIHRQFPANERRIFFGDYYTEVKFEEYTNNDNVLSQSESMSFTIAEIINPNESNKAAEIIPKDTSEEKVEVENEVYIYKSIIDFPNFLMHVLKLYRKLHSIECIDIPLNESELLTVYNSLEETKCFNAMDFIRLLLFCRVLFDRFVIKTMDYPDDPEDGEKWVLVKPIKYDKSNWKFTETFGPNDTKRIIKAMSMLQVTFRTRIYKNWLYETLNWLYESCKPESNSDLTKVNANAFLKELNRIICDFYNAQDYSCLKKWDNNTNYNTLDKPYSEGTKTPHFLLNFIDYLFWMQDSKSNPSRWGLKPFDYKYWNSIEHHLSQNKAGDKCPFVDNLGNLCLVSRSSNSRLSDRDVKEKVQVYGNGNLGPNRQLIYRETEKNNFNWNEKEIQYHYNEIVELLNKRNEILEI